MSSSIETLNRGRVEDFGFYSADGSRIRLGALPPISYEKFCVWSTDTIIEFLKEASGTKRTQLRKVLILSLAKTKGLRIRNNDCEKLIDPVKALDKIKEGDTSYEAVSDLASALVDQEGLRIHNYPENPFRIRDEIITIGNFYDVNPVDFSCFALHYISGGHFGWNPNYGIDIFASRNLRRLSKYFEVKQDPY